ncbi:glycosyltransferase [Vulcanococcus limneticus]|uniref:glycosyltransferase family 2 protein n=1 Tax=Vulcanococcus limneticus TaxID=2170428 RepID=UPI00398C159D
MRLPWAVLLLTLLGGRYLAWRLGSTLNLDSPLAAGLSLVMLLAELALLITAFLQLWFTLAPDPGIAALAERAAAELEQRRRLDPGALPAVDVLVPSYGEPLELIGRCLRGCRAIDYPKVTVWLLDDSGRPELERLCTALGCRYLAREQREHAKAGNLNHALPHLDGDLLAVFDADVVPQTSFLARTAGLFADPAVGFVQTPQSYMNADPVIRNLRLERWLMPDEETFYRWVEPVRQGLNAVVCAGTSFVMRRSALLQVGGFETGTPSEDLATGIRLAAAGYRNLFVGEKLSAGLAPFTLAAMARQRCRWASGTLQTLRTGASPFTISGLKPLQRLAFLEGILHWCNVLPQLVLVLMPLSIGVLGVAPLRVSGDGLLLYALPFYGVQLLLARWFSGQARTALLPELYRWVFLVPLAAAVVATLLGKPQRFRVTPKAPTAGRRLGAERRLLLPLLALLSLQLVSVLNLLPRGGLALAPISTATLALGLVWAGFNAVLLLLAIRTCWDRGGGDGTPWFAVDRPGALQGDGGDRELAVRVGAISAEGVELELAAAAAAQGQPRSAEGISIALPGHATPLPLRLEARRGRRLGAHWGELSAEQRDRLEHQLYRQSGLWPQRQAPFEPLALLAVLRRLLQPIAAEGWFARSLLPQASPADLARSPHPTPASGGR